MLIFDESKEAESFWVSETKKSTVDYERRSRWYQEITKKLFEGSSESLKTFEPFTLTSKISAFGMTRSFLFL